MPYSLASEKFFHKSPRCAKEWSARAWRRYKLPSAPSPFSQEVLAAVRSVARTRQPVRACPECWHSDSKQVFVLTFGATSERFYHKLLQCTKNQVYVLEDARSFHGHHHHFHLKLRQQFDPLDGLDNQSDGARRVGRAITRGWSSSANTPDTFWPVIESVRQTGPLPDLLMKIVIVPMEVSSFLKHVNVTFCTLKWLVRELFICRPVWHRKWIIFYTFFRCPPEPQK